LGKDFGDELHHPSSTMLTFLKTGPF